MTRIALVAIAICCMAPSRRVELDHVGAYNFMVEISGIEAGYFKGVDGLSATMEAVRGDLRISEAVAKPVIEFALGRVALADRAAPQGTVAVAVHVELSRRTPTLSKGRLCTFAFEAEVMRVSRTSLALRPTGEITDNCVRLRKEPAAR